MQTSTSGRIVPDPARQRREKEAPDASPYEPSSRRSNGTRVGARSARLDTYAVVAIREESIGDVERHGEISIAFEVTSVLEVEILDAGLGGILLAERPVDAPWTKDYDATDGGPRRWASRFDVSHWGVLGAYADERRIGGAVIAFETPSLHMLRGRHDLAVLWDLRVASDARRSGVGAALFRASETWARERECNALEVETQQVNVPACRFYARMGCSLAAVDRYAYADLPEEAQLIWRRELIQRA